MGWIRLKLHASDFRRTLKFVNTRIMSEKMPNFACEIRQEDRFGCLQPL